MVYLWHRANKNGNDPSGSVIVFNNIADKFYNILMPSIYCALFYRFAMVVSDMDISMVSPGPRLNIKTVLSTYGDFHFKDKTAVRTSYL